MTLPTIHERLLLVERDFLDVVSTNNPDVIASFEHNWRSLHADVQNALSDGTLPDETIKLAHGIASSVTIFADLFLSFRTESETISTEIETIFEGLNIISSEPSASTNQGSPMPQVSSVPITRPDPSLPSYIEPAYKWLLKHLHNPYPKKEVKQKIADESGSSIERISDWFVDVRRRMGWTLMLREEFGRKRIDMVDAAHRFFISPHPTHPLPPNLHGKFMQIEAFAREMYAHKFLPSELSHKLTAAVKDLTPAMQEKVREERWQKLQGQREAAKLSVYPSPAHSGASSPVSDDGASTSFAGRKRSRSDFHNSFSKRSRSDHGPTPDPFGLPSPPYSGPSSPTSTADALPSRKRRLSDVDGTGSSKRPRVASSPIPITVTLSGTPDILADWFTSDREGNTDIFEEGGLLDIKFWDPADVALPEEASPEPLTNVTPLPQLSEPETVTFDLPASDFTAEFPPDFFNFSSYTNDFSTSNPSFVSFDPIAYTGPAVYEPPSFTEYSGHGYDGGYISRESVAESFAFESNTMTTGYSALPDGKATGELINGLFEQQNRPGNEYAMYQATQQF
ncbi:C-terminal domain of homeodomain 1-domain-containing protein [Mycena crocata]|nr:C-terminal domain of homeodomain 1-domain-containing protein [Mycena crocata]